MERLQKAYSYLSKKNFAYILVLALMVKAIVSDVSYASFLITIPVLAYEAYKLFLKSKTPDPVRINQEVIKELDQMKAKLSGLTMEKGIAQKPARYF